MANYIKRIRTEEGDLQIDYTALANLPIPDKALRNSGIPADSKAVGDAIAEINDSISTSNGEITSIKNSIAEHTTSINNINDSISTINNELDQISTEVTPISRGGTGATDAVTALSNLGAISMCTLWENQEPDGEFVAQDIEVTGLTDINAYQYLLITSQRASIFIKNRRGAINLSTTFTQDGSTYIHARELYITDSGVAQWGNNYLTTLGSGGYSVDMRNLMNRPLSIVGINGVTKQ